MKPWILNLQQNQCNINVDTASTGQSTQKVQPGGRAPPARVWFGRGNRDVRV